MYYLVLYDLIDDYLQRRPQFREEHLALAKRAFENGDLVMAGALADPSDEAILVFRGEDASAAHKFVENDPYVKNGLVKNHRVRPWTVVVGGK